MIQNSNVQMLLRSVGLVMVYHGIVHCFNWFQVCYMQYIHLQTFKNTVDFFGNTGDNGDL